VVGDQEVAHAEVAGTNQASRVGDKHGWLIGRIAEPLAV
jgi:hypothetical protein